MSIASAEYKKSLYEELYQLPDAQGSIVRNTVSNEICLCKHLRIYSADVYQWLKEHHNPHVCTVIDCFEESKGMTVIEELVSGTTLAFQLENKLLSDDEKNDIFLQICDGLIFLHSADPPVIHRDIKSSNIMITENHQAKIIDYDAAKFRCRNESRDTVLIGTQGSAAPEQYGFGPSDERTDIYALGILMKEMFPDDKIMQRIAQKAVRLDPKDRYKSVKELAARIPQNNRAAFSLNIPGFRSGRIGYMLGALFGYIILFALAFTMQFDNNSGIRYTWINRIAFLAVALSWIDLFSSWSGFYEKLPWMKSLHIPKVIGYCISAILILFFYLFIAIMIQ